MFSNTIYTLYLVTRKYKGQYLSLVESLDSWVCLTKKRTDETIKESKSADLAGRKIDYTIQRILLR